MPKQSAIRSSASPNTDAPAKTGHRSSIRSAPCRARSNRSCISWRAGWSCRIRVAAPSMSRARRPLALPTRAAAEAVAAEWNAVGEFIDPLEMPLTRIVNVAIDGVTEQMDSVLAEVVGYVGSDLLVYRAGEPEQLVAEQARLW